MAEEGIIAMNQKELKRLHIIHRVLDKRLRQVEAAEILGLSTRQIGRLTQRIQQEGDKGIIHKSRGRPSNRALPQRLKDKVIKLYRERYPDFGPTLANEKLFEINKINIGNQTLRNWLIADGAWQIMRKHSKYRQWRQRKHSFGQMVQIDGSHHDWFEGRASECVLMGYIDDATGNVFGNFYDYEGTRPAMDSLKRYIKRYGIPQSVYLDKHTTYKSTRKPSIEDELNNTKALSQLERVFQQLGVNVIHANSPQAKGRIERSFNTHQDRLIKEMRLAGINTLREANRFLHSYYIPKHNRRFAIPAGNKADLHRPIPRGLDLDRIFSIKEEAAVRNDFTLRYDKKLYQILENPGTKKVAIEERLNGRLCIYHKDKQLKYKPIDTKPEKPKIEHKPRKVYRPPMEHPFKGPMFRARYPGSSYAQEEKAAQKEKELLLV
jgi:hypothetical protein